MEVTREMWNHFSSDETVSKHTLVEKKYEISEHCNMANSIQNQLELQGEIVSRIISHDFAKQNRGAKLMPNYILCPQAKSEPLSVT